jgi:hypothetical protein
VKSILQRSHTIFVIATLIIVLVNEDFTQSRKNTADSKVDKCGKDCIFKENGFLLPKLRSEKILQEKVLVFGENRVVEKKLDIDPEFITLSEKFSANNENLLDLAAATKLATYFASRYEVNDRVFAYRVFYNPIIYSEDKKQSLVIESRSRCIIVVFYIDKNGDGVFETIYKSLDLPIEVPQWASSLGK